MQCFREKTYVGDDLNYEPQTLTLTFDLPVDILCLVFYVYRAKMFDNGIQQSAL